MDFKVVPYSAIAPTCGLLLGTGIIGIQPVAIAQPVSDAASYQFTY